ncbi:MAG TPA: MFS transporter, partial [Bacteroidia bacterium]
IYLHFYPGNYRELFLITFAPGIVATSLTFLIKEKPHQPSAAKRVSFFSFLHYWKESSPAYRKLVAGLLVFALFNSSDIFLLLKMKDATHDDSAVIGIYIFYNIVYALTSYPIGALGDKIGLKTVFLAGLFLFAAVYAGMAFFYEGHWFYVLFFLYGIYAASTEGISKAWITNLCKQKDTATAIGTFTAFQSICTMLASMITGLLWMTFNAQTAFVASAVVTLLVMIYLMTRAFPDEKRTAD